MLALHFYLRIFGEIFELNGIPTMFFYFLITP
jgi:hypothetical protein